MKVLANQRHEFHKVEGEVWYDSLPPEQIEAHYRGDVQYCPEDDVHFPTLTVDQTLRFAAETRTPRQRIDDIQQKALPIYRPGHDGFCNVIRERVDGIITSRRSHVMASCLRDRKIVEVSEEGREKDGR